METPSTTTYKLRHAPTPKMSQRKKSLFSSKHSEDNTINEDSDLGPITPLDFSSPVRLRYDTDSVESTNERISVSRAKENIPVSFKNILSIISPIKQNTQILNESHKVFNTSNYINKDGMKHSVLKTPSDSSIKAKSPKVSSRYTRSNPNPILTPTMMQIDNTELVRLKRNLDDSDTLSSQAPERKILKVDNEKSKARTSLSFTDVSISTKSFYASKTSSSEKVNKNKSLNQSFPSIKTKKQHRTIQTNKRKKYGIINKGVGHKIMKKKKPTKKKNRIDLSKVSTFSLLAAATNIIENSKLNDYLTTLKTFKDKLNENVLTEEQLKPINGLLKSLRAENHISQDYNDDNEYDEYSGDDEDAENDKMDMEQNHVEIDDNKTKKKFFKSRINAKNTYKITDTLSATVNKGKIHLNKPKIKKHLSDKVLESKKLQLGNLIDKLINDYATSRKETEIAENNLNGNMSIAAESKQKLLNTDENEKFFKMLPYNTSDPVIIERQHNVLKFLIINNICTEENFKIFISESDLHKEKANKIIDDLYEIKLVPDATQSSPQHNDNRFDLDGPLSPTSQISNMTSELAIDHEKNSTARQEKYYDIFTNGAQILNSDSNVQKPVTNKKNWRLIGDDQYQIDAGQKEFGAKTCTECGLIYTVHVPEDELLHINFHNKANVLKFKGWANEQIVKTVNEWGVRGRIIVLSANDTKVKLKKVNDLFDLLSNEMGNTNIVLKDNSMIYLALNQSQIMGVCVAEPLLEAHRIQNINNLHFYSKDVYSVKCGVSRIWVSPLHRRQGVAKQLINAIQTHFIFGTFITMDEIAFSSPTELGQCLAENLTNRKDFLIY